MILRKRFYEFIKENRGINFVEIEGKFGSGNATIELKNIIINYYYIINIIIRWGLKYDVVDAIN